MLGIRVISQSGAPPGAPVAAVFGDAGGDIGRGADCTLVLADPGRHISRRQALIACRDGRHYIRQIGTNLAIEIDGVPLPLDVDFPLHAGARIRIGTYVLCVEETVSPGTVPPLTAEAPVAKDPLAAEVDGILGDAAGAGQRPAPNASPPAQGEQGVQALSAPELFAALYAGLGLPTPAPVDQSAQALHHVGALLRNSIEGTLSLLAARSIAKRELGASMTVLQPRENNPLKFAPDLDTALAQLLRPAQRGFTPPLAAVADAFNDLRAHEVAVLVGMRAVLNEVVSRFNPESLVNAPPMSAWETLLPGSREAKLWAQYCERYAEIARDAELDFNTLFDNAFREAYEKQLAELASAPSRTAEPSP